MEIGDEFAVAGNEEAGAGGDLFAGGVGHDQQHDRRSGFFGERLEINRFGFGADVSERRRGESKKQQKCILHTGRIGIRWWKVKSQLLLPALATAHYSA